MRYLSRVLLLALLVLPNALWAQTKSSSDVSYRPDVTITLRTDIADGKLVYVSESGLTRGQVNPDLRVPEGAVVQINLINGDGAVHDIAVPEFEATSSEISGKGAATSIVFRATRNGTFEYYCTLPGHKAAGMVGKLVVGDGPETVVEQGKDLSKDPTQVGEPVGNREPKSITLDLRTTEEEGRLSDGSTYKFWTFDGTVPGPMVRIREGDTVTLNLSNEPDSAHIDRKSVV